MNQSLAVVPVVRHEHDTGRREERAHQAVVEALRAHPDRRAWLS